MQLPMHLYFLSLCSELHVSIYPVYQCVVEEILSQNTNQKEPRLQHLPIKHLPTSKQIHSIRMSLLIQSFVRLGQQGVATATVQSGANNFTGLLVKSLCM